MHYLRLLLTCAATLLILNLAAPYVLERSLTSDELVALAALLIVCAAVIHKERASRRKAKLEEMRDSALW